MRQQIASLLTYLIAAVIVLVCLAFALLQSL